MTNPTSFENVLIKVIISNNVPRHTRRYSERRMSPLNWTFRICCSNSVRKWLLESGVGCILLAMINWCSSACMWTLTPRPCRQTGRTAYKYCEKAVKEWSTTSDVGIQWLRSLKSSYFVYPVVPRGEALLSGHSGHPDWLQDWPQEGQRVCEEAQGHEYGSHHLHTGKGSVQTVSDL